MSSLDFNAPLTKYFCDEVVASFASNGIESIDEIFDFVVCNPSGWSSVLKWDAARANGLIKWLYDNQKNGNFELPAFLIKKAEKLNSPYYSKTEPLENIEALQWEKVVNPQSRDKKTSRRAGEKADFHKIHTLETICLPPELDGSQGTNRGKRENCALQADRDTDAIMAWLAARATNKNTQTVYRKEAERFLLWGAFEKDKAMSSLSIEDCSEYLRWLEQLGRTDEKEWTKRWREPQTTWIGPKNVPRTSPDWKPFNSALSLSSRRSAFVVVRQLFSFLQKTGYLQFNPFDQIPSKIPLLPGEGKPKEFADRSLTHDQWNEILAALDALPSGEVKSRLKVILLLGKGLGMRAQEMINARCGWIDFKEFEGRKQAMISVIGKGDKERELPLSDEQVDIINEYLSLREAGFLGDPESSDTPILVARRKSRDLSSGLSRSGLYRILADFLESVAKQIQKERPVDASKLRASSTHWLRHTFAVTSLETMPVNVVQNALGHASVGTTSRYIKPDQREIIKAMDNGKPL